MAQTGHLQVIDHELTAMIEEGKDTKSIVKWVKERVLESYKNGLQAGKGEQETSAPRAPSKPLRNYKK